MAGTSAAAGGTPLKPHPPEQPRTNPPESPGRPKSAGRVKLTNDGSRRCIGLIDEDGKLIRIESPNLVKSMGRNGVREADLKPQPKAEFKRQCIAGGVELPVVIDRRYEAQERERQEMITGVLEYRAKMIAREISRREKILNQQNDEMIKLKEVWLKVDADGSGDLSHEEVKQVFVEMGKVLIEADFKKVIESMDLNGDGTIDFDEFREWWASTMLADEMARRLAIEKQHDARRLEAMVNKGNAEVEALKEAKLAQDRLIMQQLRVQEEEAAKKQEHIEKVAELNKRRIQDRLKREEYKVAQEKKGAQRVFLAVCTRV